MPREQFQHVIEKPNPRLQIGLARAIEIQRNLHLGLARLTREVGGAIVFVIGGFLHKKILGDGGRLQ